MSESRNDAPRWTTPLFWAAAVALVIAVLLFAEGGCYSPELDRMVDCPGDSQD